MPWYRKGPSRRPSMYLLATTRMRPSGSRGRRPQDTTQKRPRERRLVPELVLHYRVRLDGESRFRIDPGDVVLGRLVAERIEQLRADDLGRAAELGNPHRIELDDVSVATAVDDLEPGGHAPDLAAEDAPRRAHVGAVPGVRPAPERGDRQALGAVPVREPRAVGHLVQRVDVQRLGRFRVAEIGEDVGEPVEHVAQIDRDGLDRHIQSVVVDEQRVVGEELRLLRAARDGKQPGRRECREHASHRRHDRPPAQKSGPEPMCRTKPSALFAKSKRITIPPGAWPRIPKP